MDVLRERLRPLCQRSLRSQVQAAGHISFVRRNAQTFHFDPSDSEQKLYEELSAFLKRKDTFSYGAKSNQLVILQIRKILGSSSFAVARYLETLIERLKARKAAALNMT
ncbi:MAG: ATP-dependent helicase, partial [bacterium]